MRGLRAGQLGGGCCCWAGEAEEADLGPGGGCLDFLAGLEGIVIVIVCVE